MFITELFSVDHKMKFFGRWVSKTSATEAPTTTMEAPAERAKDRGDYVADRAEDVTQKLKSCVETAEEARDTLSEVLRIFHPQGKQTTTVDQAMGDNIEPTWVSLFIVTLSNKK